MALLNTPRPMEFETQIKKIVDIYASPGTRGKMAFKTNGYTPQHPIPNHVINLICRTSLRSIQ